ncbi:MAG: hypothetical protein M1281_14895 [Chloroflexi bacterium]|nr:hypothetical protein [Chloroflexota bacterium]
MSQKPIDYAELNHTLDFVEDHPLENHTWLPDALLDIRSELEFVREARAFIELLTVHSLYSVTPYN